VFIRVEYSAAIHISAGQAVGDILEIVPHPGNSSFVNTITDGGTFHIPFDQAGTFEYLKVLGHGRLCQRQFIYDVAANAGIYLEQVVYDRYSCRMPKGFYQGGYFVLPRSEMVCFGSAHIVLIYCNNTIK
jgi:hypothetical protein